MKVIFATSNPEKIKEAKIALATFGHEVVGMDFPFVEPTDGTMEEIARYKLSQIKDDSVSPIFVDDSGIFFEAYNNFPGILTRRIFDLIGYYGIDKLLTGENRKAYFHGVIAVKWKDNIQVFDGKTYGAIVDVIPNNLPSGLRFPFDPIFLPEGSDRVLGEMLDQERVGYSYRKKALVQMGKWLNSINE